MAEIWSGPEGEDICISSEAEPMRWERRRRRSMVSRISAGKSFVEAQADELHLAAGVEELGEGAVGKDDAQVGREGDDAVGDGFDDGFELGAALLEGGVEFGELGGGLLGEGA